MSHLRPRFRLLKAVPEVEAAVAAMEAGDRRSALNVLWNACGQIDLPDEEYDAVLELFATYLGETRSAFLIWLYLRDIPRLMDAARSWPDLSSADRARAYGQSREDRLAIEAYLEHGWRAHAAMVAEDSRCFDEARILWRSLCENPGPRADCYVQGLLFCKQSMMSLQCGDHVACADLARRAVALLHDVN